MTIEFRRYHAAGFTSELLPIIPPGAELVTGSTVQPHHLGKTPGTRRATGAWGGLTGKWSDDLHATLADLKRWHEWGASVGIQSRKFLGLDIDIDDEGMAAAVERLANDYLGFAPIRYREGSPRRLMMFTLADAHPPVKKVRFAWKDARGVKHAVELLGKGQQYVIAGPHPKGGEYKWREDPCDTTVWGPDNLTPIDTPHINEFFRVLVETCDAFGWGETAAGSTTEAGTSNSGRKPLTDPSLWAPTPELALEALQAIPCTAEEFPTRDDLVKFLAAVKASLGPAAADSHWPDVLDWALQYDGAEEAFVAKIWDSFEDSALGWDWLAGTARGHGFTGDAQADFAEPVAGNQAGAVTGEDDDSPMTRACKRYVWCRQIERYVDLKEHSIVTPLGFNAANTGIAAFGRSGTASAHSEFQNNGQACSVAMATYRPGSPALLKDHNEAGVLVSAVNLWRPPALKPAEGVTDADVAPWLDLLTELFGEAGDPAREHFLNWLGYAVQHVGAKINHALVLVGGQGVGKDTILEPLREAIGRPNCTEINPGALTGGFTHYLQRHLVVVQEMMTHGRREIYNGLKALVATPPHTVEINRKNQHPYTIPNMHLWVFMTNYEDALSLDEDDRRFWVHQCLLETPKPKPYYDALYGWYAAGGYEKVVGWLKARDVRAFGAKAAPPSSDAKTEMIELSAPPAVRWLADQFAEGGAFEGRELVTARELVNFTRQNGTPRAQETVREKHAVSVLKRAGYKAIDRKVRIEGAAIRLWTNQGRPDMMAQLPAERLIERHAKDVKGSGAKRAGA